MQGSMIRVVITTAVAALMLAVAQSAAAAVSFTAQGSAEQVYVTGLGAEPADVADQRAPERPSPRRRRTRSAGCCSATSRREAATACARPPAAQSSAPSRSTPNAAAPWDPSVYNQTINPSGYQYLTTRDGTKLAIDVHPPQDVSDAAPAGVKAPALGSAPRPTLIEYAGYGYANPAGPDSGISILANLMGFTVVDVNMRGTGLLGRRLRLLRDAPEPRRLRRDRDDRAPAVGAEPQGRDDGHLLRRRSASCSPLSSTRPTSRRSRRCR